MIETKFSIGDKVTHFTGAEGMVIAIFIRGNHTAYEFATSDSDGIPKAVVVEECEISKNDNGILGFKKAQQ